jgi:hypothetical protein
LQESWEKTDKLLTKVQGSCLMAISSVGKKLDLAKLLILSKRNKKNYD